MSLEPKENADHPANQRSKPAEVNRYLFRRVNGAKTTSDVIVNLGTDTSENGPTVHSAFEEASDLILDGGFFGTGDQEAAIEALRLSHERQMARSGMRGQEEREEVTDNQTLEQSHVSNTRGDGAANPTHSRTSFEGTVLFQASFMVPVVLIGAAEEDKNVHIPSATGKEMKTTADDEPFITSSGQQFPRAYSRSHKSRTNADGTARPIHS